MDNITLRWQGPFTLVPTGDLPDIYRAAEAKTPGIYLWALPFEQAYLINYVGIAAESVSFTNSSGVLYGQKMADPALMPIGLNIVRQRKDIILSHANSIRSNSFIRL